jgi:hypothetical protein
MKLWIPLLFFSFYCAGQETDLLKIRSNIYAEVYYLNSSKGAKSPLFYNHTSVNTPAINVGMVEFFADKKRWSFQSGIMVGTYSQKNLAAEPKFWKQIYQLNLQFQLDSKSQLMAGIFPSHIGLESTKNVDNDCFSRSYLAENSPYYESGLAWNYNPSTNLSFRLLALTGWQTIAKFNPSLGAQVVYTGKSGWKFNASQFLGNEGKGTRVFLNNFAQIPISKQFSGTIGFDAGFESSRVWHGGLAFLTWKPHSKIRMSSRVEYYSDPHAIIMPAAFTDIAKSISLDYTFSKKFMLRSEFKNSNKFGNEFLFGGLILFPTL